MFFLSNLSRAITSAGLAIKAGGSAVAKTANAFRFYIEGNVKSGAAGDVSLTGINIATGYKSVIAVLINAAGTYSTTLISTVANAADFQSISFDYNSPDKSVVGFILVTNATGSVFTGGTTALDTGSLTVEYLNCYNPQLIGR